MKINSISPKHAEPPQGLPAAAFGTTESHGVINCWCSDVAVPGTGLVATALLDELLEVLGRDVDLALIEAEGGARLLDRSIGLPPELDRHAS